MNIIKIIKDFWAVLRIKSVFTDINYCIMCIIFGGSLGSCCAAISDYNAIGLIGWLVIAVYWFIEISKLNNKTNDNYVQRNKE